MPAPESVYFIDTSFHIAYFFEDDDYHSDARTSIDIIYESYPSPTFVTTNFVFQETINRVERTEHIRSPHERARVALQLGKDIFDFNEVYLVDNDMLSAALELYFERNQRGPSWGFTDCSSFIFIREIRKKKYGPKRLTIRNALSFDKHFHEAAPVFKFEVAC